MAMNRKVRKDNLSIDACTDNFTVGYYRSDQAVQRLAGIWVNNMRDSLLETACNGEYIPPLILAEESCDNGTTEVWLVDGLQRLSTFVAFKNNQYKITKGFKGSVVYSVDEKDENGKFIYDENNHRKSHIEECVLGGKYYSDLPIEVKRLFDQCSLDLVFHQNCTELEISKLVAKYNNHKAMNANQIAFTLIPRYAREIRNIVENSNCVQDYIMPNMTPTKQIDGTLERMIIEACCLLCFPSAIATNFKVMAKNMNDIDNGSQGYSYVDTVLTELNDLFDEYPDVAGLYNSKNGAINIKVFDLHRKLNIDNKYFADFMMTFNWVGLESEMKKTNANRTKSVSKINRKIEILEESYIEYLKVNCPEYNEDNESTEVGETISEITMESKLDFIHSNVESNSNEEDIELYEETLTDLTLNVDNNSPLLNKENHLALLGIVAYSYVKDIDIDDWFIDYFKRNTNYNTDNSENYIRMLKDLKVYLTGKGVA